jgi:type VI protein secretion system component VasK
MGTGPGDARTVLPPRRTAPQAAADLLPGLAAPVLAFAADLAGQRRPDTQRLARQAGDLLDLFEDRARTGGLATPALKPARYGLAVVIDEMARRNRAIPVKVWAATAGPLLMDGRDVSLAGLRDLHRKAAEAGGDYADLARFLADCIAGAEGVRGRIARRQSSGALRLGLFLGSLLLVAGLAGALWADWRFTRGLMDGFAAELARLGPLDPAADLRTAAAHLDAIRAAADQVAGREPQAPVGIVARLPGLGAAARADAAYRVELATVLPDRLALAIDAALATEGDGLMAWDTLRAQAILAGRSGWNPAFVAGWVADRPDLLPGLGALAPHAAGLTAPPAGMPVPDGELLAQAQGFAAEVPEATLAFLELRRSAEVAALPGWSPDSAVPGLSDVLLRRSGVPMATPVPALYTAAGWAHARDFGAGLAVQAVRHEAPLLLATALPRQNDAPDRVMDVLQDRTLDVWQDWLADLRVQPFRTADTAILVSGRLALRQNPLGVLLGQVWEQAGGTDRTRSFDNQRKVAATFGAAIQYVEQGRLAEISDLFAALNVALGSMAADEERGLQRLMGVQDRASSVRALVAAPPVVVSIVEDVLAQAGAAGSGAGRNPVAQLWQSQLYPACRALTDGRFPFAEGPDADLDALAAFLGPGGQLDRFLTQRAAGMLDRSASPWRWKPEARFAGLNPDSAAFLQRAAAVGEAFFAEGGTASAQFSLAALAQRGEANVSVGGQGAAVTTTAGAVELAWPGPEPERGVEVSFRHGGGTSRLASPGAWGLFRQLAVLRLRERDGGRTFLIDLRAEGGRLFVDMTFATGNNPLARRALVSGLACPAVL